MVSICYEYYNINDDNAYSAYDTHLSGQTFTIGTTGINNMQLITNIKLLLYRQFNPGDITINIYKTNSIGYPIGNSLSTGTTISSTLPTVAPYEWRNIILTPCILTKNTQYAIIMSAIGNIIDEVRWRSDITSPTYSGGAALVSNDGGINWTIDTTKDLMFEIWGTSFPFDTFFIDSDNYNLFLNIPDTISLNDSENIQIYNYEYIDQVDTFSLGKNTENITLHGFMNSTVSSYSAMMQEMDNILNNGEKITISGFSNPLFDGSWVIEDFTYKVTGGYTDSFEYDMTLERA